MKPIGFFSRGISSIPFLDIFIGCRVVDLNYKKQEVSSVIGWGLKENTKKPIKYSIKYNIPFLSLEDGFLRSYGTGDNYPALSMIIDDVGIYYDSNLASKIENILSNNSLITDDKTFIYLLKFRILNSELSKYNHSEDITESLLRKNDLQRILVVDQTMGDMSVILGGACSATFQEMLRAALDENPSATIYVKTHPEVNDGRKRGYLTATENSERVVVLREAVNPISLIRQMDKVYVVSSTMGFEALLANKPVTCFGVPWYAGWGVTDDRQSQHPAMQRRAAGTGRNRTIDELFFAAYIQYTRYLNPETHQLGNIEDVMGWLERQRYMAKSYAGRMIVVGFRRWKAANVQPMLSLKPGAVVFVKNTEAAAQQQPQGEDCLICWGRVPPAGLEALAQQRGVRLLRMEDGFVRSVGLGSDLIPPQSFVLDERGIYFDPSQPSDLEDMLNNRVLTHEDLERAQKVRSFIVQHGITKYNLEPLMPVKWDDQDRQVILVPGQVEDDASIRFGCDSTGVCTNIGLLQAAREEFCDAFIVYKPHPDVASGNRRGKLVMQKALQWADHVETKASIVSCIEACDVVVTMTSLTGFDALLRGKKVVVHGRPFYAGWGLTQDKLPVPRRSKNRTLDELVACALLHYPLYWDPVLRGYTTCEAVLNQLLERREALRASAQLGHLQLGSLRRQWRKLQVLIKSLLPRKNI